MCEENYKGYLLKSDMKIIAGWANNKNICISFRQAGDDTLKCLSRGAGAKPHEILDKTLKRKKILVASPGKFLGETQKKRNEEAEKHNAVVEEFFSFAPEGDDREKAENLLMGLVGHWVQGKVDGLYVTMLGRKTLEKKNMGKIVLNENQMPYLEFSADGKEKLIEFYDELEKEDSKKALYRFTRLFFSGDYDIHDMLQVGYPIPTETDEKLLAELQQDLLAGRRARLKTTFSLSDTDLNEEIVTEEGSKRDSRNDYRRVQHGPQFNYTAQMVNENARCKTLEELNILVNSVMQIDAPVLMHDDNAFQPEKWGVLSDCAKVADYYKKKKGRELKCTWVSQSARNRYIRGVICKAIEICYGSSVNLAKVDFDDLSKKVPGFEKAYGKEQFKGYFDEALEELANKRLA